MNEKNKSGTAAARTVSALAGIARGAATSGLHGAVTGAAISFLPELIKVLSVTIAVLIVMPVLIFTALPNILFGYNSADADDIREFTEKAYSIDAAYKEVKDYDKAEIGRIIEETIAANTAEHGPMFDDIEITEKTDNTNIYWLIAITSVAHQQNLFTMDAASIKAMTVGKMNYSSSIAANDDSGATKETKTLKIDIEDMNPYELMDKLEFNDEERNWAHVLYSTLADEQYVGINDSDGAGYYGTDYGDIIFSDVEIEVVYYNQTDARWGNIMYGKTGTIGTSGCGPTALAIVVASLTGNRVTPDTVAKWAYENGYRSEGSGSYHSLIPDGGRHYGLAVEGLGSDSKKLLKALADGKLVIAVMAKGHFTSSGHFIVLRGLTTDGKVLVADPASIKRSNQEWDLKIILNEARRGAGSGAPFWALG